MLIIFMKLPMTKKINNACQCVFQNVLDDITGNRGGAIYLPSKNYNLTQPIKLPLRCILFGFSGGYPQAGVYIGSSQPYYTLLIKVLIPFSTSATLIRLTQGNIGNLQEICSQGLHSNFL